MNTTTFRRVDVRPSYAFFSIIDSPENHAMTWDEFSFRKKFTSATPVHKWVSEKGHRRRMRKSLQAWIREQRQPEARVA